MGLFLQRLFDALSNGAVYAALAVGLSIVYRSSALLNFAFGELSMAATFFALVLSVEPTPLLPGTRWAAQHLGTPWPFWVVVPAVMMTALVGGALLERVLVRVAARRSVLAVVSVTLGVGLAANGLAAQIFGNRFFAFPTPFPTGPQAHARVGSARLSYETMWIVGLLAALLVAMGLAQRYTKLGLAFRAVASNPDSAALSGIDVGGVLGLGWGIAGSLGALAGVLVSNSLFVSSSMMSRLFIFALAAVTIGGLDSPAGAVLGGLFLAFLETMLSGYVPGIGGDFGIVAALAVLIIVLMVRPSGVFGRTVPVRL
jgi:branched-chain amino acid transport system permease protein